MDTLTQDCTDGVELRDPQADGYLPVDFVATGDAASLVFLAGWWRGEWNGPAHLGVVTYPRPIVRDEAAGAWAVQDLDVTIGSPDTGDMRRLVRRNRDESDFERPVYLSALLAAKAEFPDVRFDPWIAAFMARPLRDPLAEFVVFQRAERDMARVFLLGPDGRAVDVLVLDERGEAAQAGGDAFLSRAADDFTTRGSDRPPLADYVNWLADQTPYGGETSLSGPTTFRSGGRLDEVAAGLMAGRR